MRGFLFILLFLPSLLRAQILTTIAGNGLSSCVTAGMGGAAATASICKPIDIVADDLGGFYFSGSFYSRRIFYINASGIISVIAGTVGSGSAGDGGPATNATFEAPFGLALDGLGNLYVADQTAERVRKINLTTGIISTLAGTGVSGYSGDGGPATAATLYGPVSVAIDRNGNLLIADNINNRVREVNLTSGIITTIAGTGPGLYGGDGGPASATSLIRPYGICVDDTGSIFIADRRRVMRIDTFGIITTYAGDGTGGFPSGDGGPATAATMGPRSMAFDSHNNMYIAEYGWVNSVIRKVDVVTGIISTVSGIGGVMGTYAGDGVPAQTASLAWPVDLFFDTCDNLIFTEGESYRVRKIFMTQTGLSAVNDTVCAGSPATLTATATSGTVTGYEWYVNETVVPGAAGSSYSYVPSDGDSVRCVLTIQSCGYMPLVTSTPLVYLAILPDTLPVITLSGITTASLSSTVTVTATVSSAGSSYSISWYRNGGLLGTTTIPEITYTKTAGTDTITATITSTSAGCYDTAVSGMHIIAQELVSIAAPATAVAVRIFPNPAHESLYIELSGIAVCRLLGVAGNEVQRGAFSAGRQVLSLSGLPAGIYLLEVTSHGERKVFRVVHE